MGRPRDPAIDEAVLATAVRHLARYGYAGLSLAAVATEAGTTRPALYRRWAGKEELVVAALATVASASGGEPTGHPYLDLVSELEAFAAAITSANSLPVVGLMLTDGVSQRVTERYRQQVVAPRRRRVSDCLLRAVADGQLPGDADISIVVPMLTGSWYAAALSGDPPPRDWARRVARAAWSACGGVPPDEAPEPDDGRGAARR